MFSELFAAGLENVPHGCAEKTYSRLHQRDFSVDAPDLEMVKDIEDHAPSDGEARGGETEGDAPDDAEEGEDSESEDWITALEKALHEPYVGDEVVS